MGIPNDHIDPTQPRDPLPCVNVPPVASIDALKQIDAQVVADAEYIVLNGYVDQDMLSNPFWGAVAEGLLGRFQSLSMLTLLDLVVHDGQTVVFSNTPTVYFNKVTVYGSGTLDFQSDCKMIAHTFESIVPAVSNDDIGGVAREQNPERR
jgi:hypothetical protein